LSTARRLPAVRHTTRQLADSYIRLCHNPTRDLRGWLDAQDRTSPGRAVIAASASLPRHAQRQATLSAWKAARGCTRSRLKTPTPTDPTHQPTPRGGHHGQTRQSSTRAIADATIRLCQNPLHDLRGWLDARGCRGPTGGDLSPRPLAGLAAHGGMRSLRTARDFRSAGPLITAPCATDAGIDLPRAQAAYAKVFSSFESELHAVAQNRFLTPEQRQAMIATIRLQQRQAAEAARQWVLDDERAAARTRVQRRSPPRRHRR
jgi:hypothetical protein